MTTTTPPPFELPMHVAPFAASLGVPYTISRNIGEDEVWRLEGRLVIGTKIAFALERPELKGWEFAEAWIAHKIHDSYVRALARNDARVDRLQAEHDDEPLSEIEKYALVRQYVTRWNRLADSSATIEARHGAGNRGY